jgi:hypothetical protein
MHVGSWHKAAVPTHPTHVRYQGMNGLIADIAVRLLLTPKGDIRPCNALTNRPPLSTLRMHGAFVAPCIAQLSSGRSVSTGNPGSLFRDGFEFARRPGAYRFYFG